MTLISKAANVFAQKLTWCSKTIVMGTACLFLLGGICSGQQSNTTMTAGVRGLLYQDQQHQSDDSSRRPPPLSHVAPVNAERLVAQTGAPVQILRQGERGYASENGLRAQPSPNQVRGQTAVASPGNQPLSRSSASISGGPPRLEYSSNQIRRDTQVRPAVLDREVPVAKNTGVARNEMSPVIDILDRINSRMSTPQDKSSELTTSESATNSRSIGLITNPGDEIGSAGNNDSATLDVSSMLKPEELSSTDQSQSMQVGSANQSDFTKLIEKVCYSTLFVLVVGIGFVFVAKKIQGKGVATPAKAEALEFDVIGKIDLSPKAALTLVQVGEERIVVASDSIGVKSVVHLNGKSSSDPLTSFGEAMELADIGFEPTQLQTPLETKASTYSLEEIGSAIRKSSAIKGAEANVEIEPTRSSARPSTKRQATKNDAKIQAEMELALAKTGLKDIVLKMIQAER